MQLLREWVAELIGALLDELPALASDGAVDLVPALPEPLPLAVITEMLGFPEEDRPLLQPWSNPIASLYELEPDAAAEERAITAAVEFDAYLRELMARRQREPGEDLFSALAVMQGDRLTPHELVATAMLILNAGARGVGQLTWLFVSKWGAA